MSALSVFAAANNVTLAWVGMFQAPESPNPYANWKLVDGRDYT